MESGAPARRFERATAKADAPTVVFRPQWWLRASVIAAMAIWVAVFFLLVSLQGSPDRAFLSVAFFIALFAALGLFYNNTSIEVTDFGVIERGITSFRLLPFSDIVRVDVQPGLLQVNYTLRARRGLMRFTSVFGGHEKLMRLIVERARLGQTI